MSISKIKYKIIPILRKYGVKKASLFGSVARGGAKKGSDIDILVELPKTASLLELAGLKIAIEELLGIEADVITYKSLHHLLKERILSEQVSIL